jgi:hypothetical protein
MRFPAVLFLHLLVLLTWSLHGHAQPACTHYAAPTGSGTSCSDAQPCRVDRFWPLAGPGKTLCLKSGTYTGADQMLVPPSGLTGTQAAPITLRAEHDGKVLLDAEHQRSALSLAPGNDWFVVEGLNATNGKESIYRFGGNHGRGKRLIGWHGTSGQDDSLGFNLARGVDNVVEDCAIWGHNIRKLFSGAQVNAEGEDAQWSGFRRCWGEWNDWPGGASYPTNVYQLGYRTRRQRYENVLGTWNTADGGQTGSPDGILSFFYDCDKPLDVRGSALLGSLLYLLPGARFPTSTLANVFCTTNAAWRDVVAYVGEGHTTVKPLLFNAQTSANAQTGNTCTNCLSVHQGTPSVNSPQAGWALPGFREGQGLQAATGGASAFALLPGLCTRYEGGELTNTPLWPWPMNQRILDARAASGFPAVDVTATVESLLGPIPAACRGDAPPTPPAGTPLACVGVQSSSGVAIACTPQP